MAYQESGILRAFNAFIEKGAKDAIDKSTKASWGGGSYSVELFPDGHYRIDLSTNFGNLYNSPGLIIGIPSLDEECWDDDDPSLRYYDNAIECLEGLFECKMEDAILEVNNAESVG